MNINTVNWKGWNCNAHIDGSGNIVIDKWISPGTQPTTAEIQTASDEYDAYLIAQDAKYLQYLNKISDINYDQIGTIVDSISSLAQAKPVIKKMAYAIVALTNILKEDRKVK